MQINVCRLAYELVRL